MPCAYCERTQLVEDPAFASLPRVTSDCRPWPTGGRIARCSACGGVQKPVDDAYRDELNRIYAEYAIYAQSGGNEQRAMGAAGGLGPRSAAIVAHFLEGHSLPARGRWLDVGCGNGATLRAVSERLPGWAAVGSELDGRHRAAVEAIPGVERLYDGDLAALDDRFDAISMVHSLEHMEAPADLLRQLRRLLAPGGRLLIESPLSTGNFFDLVIADQILHFDRPALARCMQRAGLRLVRFEPQFFEREFCAVAEIEASAAPAHDEEALDRSDRKRLGAQIEWLARVAGIARERKEPLAIFGSSIGATYAFAARAGRVACFIDEDPDRIGRSHLGVPIRAPQAVDGETCVFVPLPPALASAVLSKPGRERWIPPPPYPAV